MITQNYDGIDHSDTDTYFIIGKSEKQIYSELKTFVQEHKTEDNSIWFYENPVRPSKVNLRPEFSMEVVIRDKNTYPTLMLFYRQIW